MTSAPLAGRLRPTWSGDRRWLALLALPLALLVGLLAGLGLPGGILALVGLALAALAVVGRRIVAVFPVALALLLLGYIFLDRGFAHVGVEPVFMGELVLAIGVAASLVVLPRIRIGVSEALLIAFMLWGALRTVPYIGIYGPDALRDAVTWGYGFFALAVVWTVRPEHVLRVVNGYRRIVWPLLLWFPLAIVITGLYGDSLPRLPGSTVSIISVKGGDTAVNLAGIAAFVLTGLYARGAIRSGLQEAALWVAWLLPAAATAALNRGAMAAASMAAVSALFVRSASRWLRLAVIGLLIFVGASIVNPQIDVSGNRQISFEQLVNNAVSLLSDQGGGATNQATKAWRLAWWGDIIGYTVDGPYFWTGKGFGINLANADGFQVESDGSLRAPHSVHFEILARTGVPGLVLWFAVLASWILVMLRAGLRAARSGQRFLLAVIGWVFAYWLASLVNGSVDVYIGGPQGGILFWSLFGFGLALARLASRPPSPDLPRDLAPASGLPSGRAPATLEP
ncbi:MAG: O-antigen ligase family protein [Candidatus Limnocylindrales bacterium]